MEDVIAKGEKVRFLKDNGGSADEISIAITDLLDAKSKFFQKEPKPVINDGLVNFTLPAGHYTKKTLAQKLTELTSHELLKGN